MFGSSTRHDYNVADGVTAIREEGVATGPGVLAEYAYDDLGRRVSVSRADGDGATTTYGYDAASRLASLQQQLAGTSGQTYTFTHNAAFQTLTRTGTNATYDCPAPSISATSYSVNGRNQYAAVGGANFTYDNRGNLTSTGAASFGYDAFNRLTSAGTASLAYDPAGRLYQTQQGSSVTRFLYDGLDAIAEYNASGTLLRRYVHEPGFDEPIVQYEGSGTSDRRWFVQDQLGSVIAATDASGAIIGAPNTYDEYGQPGAANTGRFQYTGQMWLAEAGVYHYKARAYDPALGRFLQTDPIVYAGGMNLYAYVGNDPINFLDPLGLQLFPSGDGPIIQQPTTTETITVTGQRPCPRGWTCSATCPMTENCNDDPFGTPALGGNTGANQLPNVEIDWNEVRRRARARDRQSEPARSDFDQCPGDSIVDSVGATQSSNLSGGAGLAVNMSTGSESSSLFWGLGVGLSGRIDMGIGGNIYSQQGSGYHGGPAIIAQTNVGVIAGVSLTGIYTPHGNSVSLDWGVPVVGFSAFLGGGVVLPTC